jgi:hypothetical protein
MRGGVRVLAVLLPILAQDRSLSLAAIATGLALFAADLASASRLSHACCSFPESAITHLTGGGAKV